MAERPVVREELRYTKDHDWVRLEDDIAVVGITDHAQEAMGDITYVEPPPVGKELKQFAEAGAVESAKAAADIYAPVSGVVAEVNAELETLPEKLNEDPYGEGWIYKLKLVPAPERGGLPAPALGSDRGAELNNLLTAQQYRALLEQSPE